MQAARSIDITPMHTLHAHCTHTTHAHRTHTTYAGGCEHGIIRDAKKSNGFDIAGKKKR